jgi:hypothetical protein
VSETALKDSEGAPGLRLNHAITDNRHRFGWINAVIGDPRTYGRVYLGTGGRGIIYGDPEPGAPRP